MSITWVIFVWSLNRPFKRSLPQIKYGSPEPPKLSAAACGWYFFIYFLWDTPNDLCKMIGWSIPRNYYWQIYLSLSLQVYFAPVQTGTSLGSVHLSARSRRSYILTKPHHISWSCEPTGISLVKRSLAILGSKEKIHRREGLIQSYILCQWAVE